MGPQALLDYVWARLDHSGVTEGALRCEDGGAVFLIHPTTTQHDANVYRPLLCAVLQGAKEVGTSTRTLTVRAGQSLIVSNALPVVSRITEATPDHPYVALVFPLDLDVLRALAPGVPQSSANHGSDPFSICLTPTDDDLQAALLRYFCQCKTEEERHMLAPITAREIHARLLIGQHGGTLQKLLWHENTASRIFVATSEIRSDLGKPLVVRELAARVGMSSSAFFEQFKAVTGNSPLQYQKDLRLLHARNELQTTGAKVSEIAYGVGYQSPAQFSREYARKFGCSPRQDRTAEVVQ
ncbi:AraC family transcriptional regulator [Phaeobacter italicus]|uniref:AraC family transcriptional regulator n=1 Tax=Phaeobacter italicus TaxID=481446 RepID=UPI001C98432C|nr:AraC family transcriptional regulator [Phaeobacter italicus]MBY5977929.1 AraC family transcriptional regulator [Phaeobacter italicus]